MLRERVRLDAQHFARREAGRNRQRVQALGRVQALHGVAVLRPKAQAYSTRNLG